jgi:glutamine amidotransferase
MIVIVDYKMGNLGSVSNIIKKIGHTSIISSDIATIANASKIILPGVGSFEKAMNNLNELGLIDILNQKVVEQQTPTLGICLGMQLMTNFSEEGNVKGLGWVNAKTVKFELSNFPELKIPHMGWNEVNFPQDHFLCENYHEKPRFYFVHSYHVECEKEENKLMTTKHGIEFTSAIVKGNITGVQFHPEKSHKFGMTLFKNFIERC